MTWIERAFDRVAALRPAMRDREIVWRLAAAFMLLPVVGSIKLWRNATWTRPK